MPWRKGQKRTGELGISVAENVTEGWVVRVLHEASLICVFRLRITEEAQGNVYRDLMGRLHALGCQDAGLNE